MGCVAAIVVVVSQSQNVLPRLAVYSYLVTSAAVTGSAVRSSTQHDLLRSSVGASYLRLDCDQLPASHSTSRFIRAAVYTSNNNSLSFKCSFPYGG